jgi:hypothetical protein
MSFMASRMAHKGKEIRHLTQYPKQTTDTELNQNQLSEMSHEWVVGYEETEKSQVNMKEQISELKGKENTYAG